MFVITNQKKYSIIFQNKVVKVLMIIILISSFIILSFNIFLISLIFIYNFIFEEFTSNFCLFINFFNSYFTFNCGIFTKISLKNKVFLY